jgi:serine/threonine-protein kinase
MGIELERGSKLGNYQLLVRIGRGGMASVWTARGRPSPHEPERLVAVKAMLPELADNMEFRAMFLDEGQIVRSIDHPNVVRVYEVGERDGILYMAMEWVEGDSLHTLIAEANKRRPIPPEVAVRMIADTAAGLHAAHELRGWDGQLREVVHCDVSPHNILIGLDGKVKLVDFGVAGAMNQLSTDDEVKIRGKFGYMSPEQAQAKPLDRRSDVFSLGIVLFELTTGYRLFRGRDDRHTLELVTWGKIPRPSQVLSKYPEKLEAIVMKALERDIEKRYQTADEFRDALETYLVEERILVPAAGVKGLLRRVLGTKIDQRRQQIRAAIRALDGAQSAQTLVSDEPLLVEEEPVSVSVSSAEALSQPSFSGSVSGQLGAAFLPGDGSSGVQTLSQPTPARLPRSNRFLLLGAGLGVVIAGAAFFVANLRPPEPQVKELGHAATSGAASAEPTGAASAGSKETAPSNGVSLDTLPPEYDGRGAPAVRRTGAAPGQPAPLTPDPEKGAHDVAPLHPEPAPAHGPEPIKVTLGEESSGDRVSEIAQSVSLDDNGAAQAPRPAAAVGFDKAAAAAALGRVAGLAGLCRRPGGDTGPGKAIVTFGPSGTVQNVSIEGKFSGTPIGNCMASQFRTVKIPPFTGDAVRVGRSFTIPD